MLPRRLVKSHRKVGLYLSTLSCSSGKQLLNNFSALIEFWRKDLLKDYCRNHYLKSVMEAIMVIAYCNCCSCLKHLCFCVA